LSNFEAEPREKLVFHQAGKSLCEYLEDGRIRAGSNYFLLGLPLNHGIWQTVKFDKNIIQQSNHIIPT